MRWSVVSVGASDPSRFLINNRTKAGSYGLNWVTVDG